MVLDEHDVPGSLPGWPAGYAFTGLSNDDGRELVRRWRASRERYAGPFFAGGSVYAAFGIIAVVAHYLPVAFALWAIAAGAFALAIFGRPAEYPRILVPRSVTFGDAGMTIVMLGDTAERACPWRAVRSVEDFSGALFFRLTGRRMLVLPKLTDPDESAALWSMLYRRLVGTRSLRSTPIERITFIEHTAAT